MIWKKQISLLTNEKTWTVITALAGAIAAIMAMLTVYHSRVSWQEERGSKRPFFVVEEPGIRVLAKSPPYRIQVTIKNIGIHPATEFEGRILILKSDLSGQPDVDINFSIANALPINSPNKWFRDDVQLPKNLPAQFVILAMKYKDPMINKVFNQIYFMKWKGIKENKTYPDFIHASREEAKTITNHLRDILVDYL